MITIGHPLPLPDGARWKFTRRFLAAMVGASGEYLERNLRAIELEAALAVNHRPCARRWYRKFEP